MRETWRQYIFGAVEPVARIAAHELGRKLDFDGLACRFDALRASDVQGRARAVGDRLITHTYAGPSPGNPGFLGRYSRRRPHGGIGGATPASRL